MYPKTAVVLAGGIGERLRPLTLATPKPLLPVADKPILAHTIENLRKQNIKNIILAVGYKAEQIREYFGNGAKFGVNITYLIEEKPLGTGGATKLASKNLKETFLVLNGDNLSDFNYKKLSEIHEKNKAKVTMALYPVEDVTKFGIADLDGDKITRFIEKPSREEAPTNLNNAGAYLIEPEVLDALPEGKCSIERDCFEKMKEGLYAYQHPGQWFPTDDLNKYLTAQKGWKGLP